MEKMLFSGVQSNSEVALIAIKGIKNQPGIAAKVFGAIAEEKINVELILQSIGRGENKDISFVVAQDEADHAVETLKKAFDEADYEDIISDKEVGIVSIVGAGMMSNSGAASKMFEALYNRGINIHLIYTSEIKITVLIKESRVERAVEALKEADWTADSWNEFQKVVEEAKAFNCLLISNCAMKRFSTNFMLGDKSSLVGTNLFFAASNRLLAYLVTSTIKSKR